MNTLPWSTQSQETFAFIYEWLQECLKAHTCSSQYIRDGDRFAALDGIRFLSILGSKVVLVENTYPKRYACLSHCWGSVEMLKTTKASIANHSTRGVLISALPQTFHDAIYTCRTLGVSHIWIDSLCIVQDDLQDWSTQASRMADVYENSFFTIAATSAKDAAEGLFHMTNPQFRGAGLPGYPDIHIWRIPPNPSGQFPERLGDSGPRHDPEDWPLLKRGWTYQELALSPRTIHFGEQEVFWQCQQSYERQCSTIPFQPISGFAHHSLRSAEVEGLGQGYMQRQWYTAVQKYSSRELTFDKDRLPAIAAIAERISTFRPNDRYLAGLWESTVLFDLIWYSPDPISDITRGNIGTHVHIPTWSWAILRNEVRWPWSHDQKYRLPGQPLRNSEVLDVTHCCEGAAVAGQILQACITLRVPLLCFNDALAKWCEIETSTAEARNERTHPILASNSSTNFGIAWAFRIRDVLQDFPLRNIRPIHDIFAVPLICAGYGDPISQPDKEQYMLLIRTTNNEGIFERVGVVVLSLQSLEPSDKDQRSNPGYSDGDAASEAMEYLQGLPTHDITLV